MRAGDAENQPFSACKKVQKILKNVLTADRMHGIVFGYEEEVSASHLDCNCAVGSIKDIYTRRVCLLKRITDYPLFFMMEVRDN